MIFDSHAHYDAEAFHQDRDSLLASMREKNVGAVVNVGSSLEGARATVELARRWQMVYGAVGIHPSDVGDLNEEAFQWLSQAAEEEKVVAIGEIGLDYYWDTEPRETQKYWFRRQLELAREKDMPVIIHSREAAQDTLELIREAGGPAYSMVIHCFSYSVEMAREYLNMGYYLGIGGVLTFKNGRKLKEVVDYMPMDRILLETDCPYLSPVPFRGKRNDSSMLVYVAEEISKIKGLDMEQVLEATWNNAKEFYRL